MNFCAGGETLLSDEVLPVVHELLCEGHYVMIVTNGTLTKRFEEISNWSEELLEVDISKMTIDKYGTIYDDINKRILNGCDISFVAEAPEDITLK